MKSKLIVCPQTLVNRDEDVLQFVMLETFIDEVLVGYADKEGGFWWYF